MLKRSAFSMIELIFVIAIMGIIGKFGVEFLANAYRNFIFSKVNHELQATSSAAVELIAAKLQHRIKASVIARKGVPPATPVAIGSASGDDFIVIEWIGIDYEGFKGNSDDNSSSYYLPNWSGIIDLDNANASSSILVSPETNTSAISKMVETLSYSTADINDTALFFIGANSDAETDYGWDGNLSKIDAQTGAMHPINSTSQIDQYTNAASENATNDFTGVDVYEYYYLAWTAYAIVYEAGDNNMGTLRMYWNYQPWKDLNGDGDADQFNDAPNVQSAVIMENVSTFRFSSIGSILKIQVCTKSEIIDGTNDGDGYSICKEKTVF